MSTLQVPVTDADHIEGDPDAPVTLVEYADYECPYCGAAYSVIKRVQKHFGKRLRFVFRNFPLTQIHPEAENAAEIAEFAGAHGRFWEMHDALFDAQDRDFDDAVINDVAKKVGLDMKRFLADMQGEARRAG